MSDHERRPPAETAYQRWELASLREEFESAARKAAKPSSSPPPAPQTVKPQLNQAAVDAAVAARLAQEMLTAREAGRQAGYQTGYETGLQEGRTTGMREGQAQALAESRLELAARSDELDQLALVLHEQIRDAREAMAQQMLALALDMARAVLKSALTVKPELLLPLIEDALNSLPALQLPATLLLHPQDLALFEHARGEQFRQAGWRLRADNQIEPGGCRIETGSNVIDATLPTRWRRLLDALGQDGDWLDGTA